MDAFSLAISLGLRNPSKEKMKLLSITIGIFHFMMPILGNKIGILISNQFLLKGNLFLSFIFFLLSLEMFFSRNSKEEIKSLKTTTILLIAFTVSIDSLTVGFAYGLNKETHLLASMIFMITSSTITYRGLKIGKKIQKRYQEKAKYYGIVIMILLSLKYLFFP